MTNRRHCFEYRRQHPELFPFFCESCDPQRRFKRPPHKSQHDKDKHGIPIPIKSYSYPQGATYSDLTLHPTPMSVSATSTRELLTQPPPRSASASLRPFSALSARELNTFVQTELEPDTEYNKSCNTVVDRLCQFMQNSFPDVLRPSEVRKAGSLGKGTAVKGKSNADLVVFLANFHSISELRENLPSIFARMKRYLGEYGGCDVTGTTPHAVQVSVHCHGHSHDADILPSVNILKTKTLHEIYKEMDLEPLFRHFYSAALAPLQIDFVSNVPAKVKNLIRLMKFWKKTEFEDSASDPDRKLPSSYLLELIVINEWKRAGSPQNFDLRKGFYQVLTAITNYRTMRLASTQNYTSHHCHDDIFVMDPANPFNNVMIVCNCWETVAEKARRFLRTADMFAGLPGLFGWV